MTTTHFVPSRLRPILLAGVLALVPLSVSADAQETRGPTTHDVETLSIENFIGTILVEVKDSGPAELVITGSTEKLDDLLVEDSGSTLRIAGDGRDWDWSDWSGWLNWSAGNRRDLDEYPAVVVTVAEGTGIEMEDVAGMIRVGDLGGPVNFESVSLEGTIGAVTEATIGVAGSGDLVLGAVAKDLDVSIAGSGDVAGSTVGENASVSIAGSGSVTLDTVAAGLSVSIAGSGDTVVQSVSGPVTIGVNGSGDVDIEEGRADPLSISINGSGDVTFGGLAVDPRISVNGSGDVSLGEYEGSLRSSGSGDVTIGAGGGR